MTGRSPGASPYRQSECAACGGGGAVEICPVCKRPICLACSEQRQELVDRTREGARRSMEVLSSRELRKERRAARKDLLFRIGVAFGTTAGLTAAGIWAKGLHALMFGAVVIPITTLNEYIEYRKAWKGFVRSRGQAGGRERGPLEMAAAASLAPCSATCWENTGKGQKLIHSTAAPYYGLHCRRCLPYEPRNLGDAIALAGRIAARAPLPLNVSANHQPACTALTCARAIGLADPA